MNSNNALAKVETTSDVAEWRALKEQAEIALSSRYLPKAIATKEQAITIAMAGRELGLPPLTAFRSIHLIEGKITMAADLMHALAYKRVPGSRVDITHTDNKKCVVEAQRPGGKPVSVSFTIEDATAAGLTGKDNWRKYPAAMLRARAIAGACRAVFPDAFLGVYTPDELEGELVPQAEAPVVQIAPKSSVDVALALESLRTAADLAELDKRAKACGRVKGLSDADRADLRSVFDARKTELTAPPVELDPVEEGEREAVEEVGT